MTSPNCYDNTSRHGNFALFSNKEEAIEFVQYKARLSSIDDDNDVDRSD